MKLVLFGIVVVFLLLVGCAPTKNAVLRREADHRLNSCLKTTRGGALNREQCRQESIQFCVDNKLERACGISQRWTRQSWEN